MDAESANAMKSISGQGFSAVSVCSIEALQISSVLQHAVDISTSFVAVRASGSG